MPEMGCCLFSKLTVTTGQLGFAVMDTAAAHRVIFCGLLNHPQSTHTKKEIKKLVEAGVIIFVHAIINNEKSL